jgi:pectate lyase
MKRTDPFLISFFLLSGCMSISSAGGADRSGSNAKQADRRRMQAVIDCADHVLAHGRDRYRFPATPLFADGVNLSTGEHVRWFNADGSKPVISDLASQQNLFRTLTALSNLTGNPKYKEAAKAAVRYHFEHLQDSSGLLQWGGHRFIDLETLRISGPDSKGLVHELKNCYPYYDLMWEVDPQKTDFFIRAFWNSHVLDWDELYVSRHGEYGKSMGAVWDHEPAVRAPLRKSPGLSFIDAGNDMIYAAATLYRLDPGQKRALLWSLFLARQYVDARHPETGLGATQFTQSLARAATEDDNDTNSRYGDRAGRQFGPEFGAVALEAWVLFSNPYRDSFQPEHLYAENALMQLELADEIGEGAEEFKDWTRSGLVPFARYAYSRADNAFKPMFCDGKDMTGYAFVRDGYYGKKGTVLERLPAGPRFLLSFERAYLHSRDPVLWETARGIGMGCGIGDLGTEPGRNAKLNLRTDCGDARTLFAVIDLYRSTFLPEYLSLARIIGDNIVEDHFHHGYFIRSPDALNAGFDAVEPYALLALQAAIDNRFDAVPPFINGGGFVQGAYLFPDGPKDIKEHVLFETRR